MRVGFPLADPRRPGRHFREARAEDGRTATAPIPVVPAASGRDQPSQPFYRLP